MRGLRIYVAGNGDGATVLRFWANRIFGLTRVFGMICVIVRGDLFLYNSSTTMYTILPPGNKEENYLCFSTKKFPLFNYDDL